MALDFLQRTDFGQWVQEVVADADAALDSARREVREEVYIAQLAATGAAERSTREMEDSVLAQPGHELHRVILERRRRHLQGDLEEKSPPDARTLLLRPELALLQQKVAQLTRINRTSDVDRAKFLHVGGPSGCGKSTLLRFLALIVQPQRPAVYMSLSEHGLDGVLGLVRRAREVTSVNFEPLLFVDDLHLLDEGELQVFFRDALSTGKKFTLITAASSPTTKDRIRELPAMKKSLVTFAVPFVPLSSHLVSWVSLRYEVTHVKAKLAAEVCGGLFEAYKYVFGQPASHVDIRAYATGYTTYIPGYRKEHGDILAALQGVQYVELYVEAIDTHRLDVTAALELLYLDQTRGPLPAYAFSTQGKYYPVSPPMYTLLCRQAGVEVPFIDNDENLAYIQNKFVVTIEKAAAGLE